MILKTIAAQELTPLHNTIGLYYEKENDIKISNNHWNLIVYKDFKLIKTAFENTEKTLRILEQHVFKPDLKFDEGLRHFIIPLKPHYTMLKTISNTLNEKINNLGLTTFRRKRFLINAAGSLIKWITGNLDATDGQYFNDAIDKLEKDDSETQTLMKTQISITTKVIQNFNNTIRKLMLDDQYLENNLKSIQTFINKNEERTHYLSRQVEILSSCETLLETYMLLNNEINDIESSLTFAKIKILHPSIISPMHLLEQIINISSSLPPNEALPLIPSIHTIGQLSNLINLQGFATPNRIVFILNIPLTNNELYTTYHLFSTPIKHPASNLYHTIIPKSKYVGLSRDNREYIHMNDIDSCKPVEDNLLCYNLIPDPGQRPPCEINIISNLKPDRCESVIMALDEYNIQALKKNRWIVIITKSLPMKTSCSNQIKTTMIHENSILQLPQGCRAFIGTIQISATEHNSTTKQDNIIPIIPYNCCENIPMKIDKMKLKPIPIRNIKLDEFHNLDENINDFKEQLYNINHKSFPYKKYAYSTILAIASLILLLLCYCCKCHKKTWRIIQSRGDDDKKSFCPQIFNQCSFSKGPQRRTSYRISECRNEEEQLSLAPLAETSQPTNAESQQKLRRVVM